MTSFPLTLRIRSIRLEAPDIHSFELVACDSKRLPDVSPGSHIELQLPTGLSRSYSLLDASSQKGSWRVAIKREIESRGGSAWFHEYARVGMTLQASHPSNDFSLIEDAQVTVLVAGGIGITPVLSMIERLSELGSAWQLHYAAGSPEQLAYRTEIDQCARRGSAEVHYYVSNEGSRMNIKDVVQEAGPETHLYCCGPTSLIDTFLEATNGRESSHVHYERFSASQAAATIGGFKLQLARTGRTIEVHAGKSILDTLLDEGVNIDYACSQGVCGTCKTGVLDGTPDHRDECLTDEERKANKSIITCCSGSQSPVLVLDI